MRKKRKLYNKTTTVVFCIPGGPFSHNFLKSWTRLLGWCINNNITPLLANPQNSVVYYARNLCLGGNTIEGKNQKPFQGKLKYDYLMWIDSDMVFKVDDFINLIKMDKDIASGIYKMEDNVNYATVEKLEDDYYINNGSYKFLNDDILKNKSDILEVDYTGFGWILFKKGIFEKLEYPWFRPLWKDFSSSVKEFTSEDVGICQILREKNLKIYINKNIKVGHEKSWILK